MKITAIGSIAYDSIITPFAKGKKLLGGSLTYFSLAASYFAKVGVVAVVGQDFKQREIKMLSRHKIDLSGLEVKRGKTFHWAGKYNFDLNNRTTLKTELNVFEHFDPILPENYLGAEYVFLGNIAPKLQLKTLKQFKKPGLIVTDTMNYWIESDQARLVEVLKRTDVLIINDSEVRELAKKSNITQATKVVLKYLGKLRPHSPTLIIKQGEYGCLIHTNKAWFSLPAFPLENVFDPTGAGDSFAGGFVGYLATQKKITVKSIKNAAMYGTTMASFTVEKLGVSNLLNLSLSKIKSRVSNLHNMTKV